MDHNWCQQFFKNTKTLPAKKRKSKSAIIKMENLSILLSTKKNKGKEYCKHCGIARYVKKSCYYLISANQRPAD